MDLRKIKALIEAVTEGDVDELEVESKEGTVRIRRNSRSEDGAAPYLVMSNPALPVSSTSSALPASTEELVGSDGDHAKDTADASSDNSDDLDGLKVVTSPIVGTFYESPSPDASSFVEVGDTVKVGQVLCIIEAMKLMNEIEAEVDGVVVKRLVSNSQPVEYGEKLFAIKPSN